VSRTAGKQVESATQQSFSNSLLGACVHTKTKSTSPHFKYKLAMHDDQFIFSSSRLPSPRIELRTLAGYTGHTMFRGSVGVLATHSTRQFPLHFPSRASPCAIRFQTHSTCGDSLMNHRQPLKPWRPQILRLQLFAYLLNKWRLLGSLEE
jgi:hypothetical protein